MNDEIDIAAADFTVTLERSTVIDFLPALVQSFMQIFIKNPTGNRNWAAFVDPLTSQAWLAIIAFLLFVPPIICCLFFYGNNS